MYILAWNNQQSYQSIKSIDLLAPVFWKSLLVASCIIYCISQFNMLSKIKVIFSIILFLSVIALGFHNYYDKVNKSGAFSQVHAKFLNKNICNVKLASRILSAPATQTSLTLNLATSTGKYLVILVLNIICMGLTLVIFL